MREGEEVTCIKSVVTLPPPNTDMRGVKGIISFVEKEKYYIYAVSPNSVAVCWEMGNPTASTLPFYAWFPKKGVQNFYEYFEDLQILRMKKLKKIAGNEDKKS